MSELLENYLSNAKDFSSRKDNITLDVEIFNFCNDIYIVIDDELDAKYEFKYGKNKKFNLIYLSYEAELDFVETNISKHIELIKEKYEDKLIDTLELFELI